MGYLTKTSGTKKTENHFLAGKYESHTFKKMCTHVVFKYILPFC